MSAIYVHCVYNSATVVYSLPLYTLQRILSLPALPFVKTEECFRDPSGAVHSLEINDEGHFFHRGIFEHFGAMTGSQPFQRVYHRPSAVVFAFLEAVRDELALYYQFLGELEAELGEHAERVSPPESTNA